MIDALISGRLQADPVKRVARNGKPYTTVPMLCAQQDGAWQRINVTAFDVEAMAALLVLRARDSVAIAGPLTFATWTDDEGHTRQNINMMAQHVLTPYSVNKRRHAQPLTMPVASPGQTGLFDKQEPAPHVGAEYVDDDRPPWEE